MKVTLTMTGGAKESFDFTREELDRLRAANRNGEKDFSFVVDGKVTTIDTGHILIISEEEARPELVEHQKVLDAETPLEEALSDEAKDDAKKPGKKATESN